MIIRSGPGPVFLAALKDATVESGTPLELTVAINAPAEPVEVVWQKDNKPVETKAKGVTASCPKGQCTLKIDPSSLADAGEYSVTVKNPSGSVRSSAKITIVRTFPVDITSSYLLECELAHV